ncbi:MAG: flavodoxin family protein [Chloroflexi bacterium]|nr:flavodoxin family protein [Chloroflexota bacterium]
MKVLGIAGSLRSGGNSVAMTREALRIIEAEGIETELVSLSHLSIAPCNGCRACWGTDQCTIEDDLQPLYERMKAAKGIILTSPVYFGSVSATMKALMERAGYLARYNGYTFSRKVGGPLVVASRVGQTFTYAQLLLWFNSLNMIVPGSASLSVGFGREKGEVLTDERGMESVQRFAQNMAWLVKKLAAESSPEDMPIPIKAV